jgi:hypothetical protein
MWRAVRRYPMAVPVTVLLLVAGVWLWVDRVRPQLADTGAQAAIYDRFQPYPGSERVSSRRYEHRADGNRTGRFGLEVVYRLPDEVTAAEALDHYRRQIPAGWTEASDQTCLDVMGRLPAPPQPAPGQAAGPEPTADSVGLLQRASRLTIFTDGSDVAAGRVEGFTVSLSRTADGKFARLDGPTYGCGGPEIDQAAVAFDAP